MATKNESIGGGVGNLSGSVYDYSTSYGGKYNIPDPSASTAAAISGTTGNLGSLYNLSSSYDTAAAQQAVDTQNVLTPGYSSNMAQWSQNISDLLSGKISGGTVNQMAQSAAELGISSGLSGSQANNSSLLRALGLESESLQSQGATQLAAQKAASPVSQVFDLSQYLTTPSSQQAAQLAANQVGAAAVPASAASAARSNAAAGVTSGLNSAGVAPASTGGGSSIASLLSSILGTGVGGGTAGGTISGNSLSDVLASITGIGSTGAASNAGQSQSYEDFLNLYGDTGGTGETGYSDVPATEYD